MPLDDAFMHRAVHVVLSGVLFWLAYLFIDEVPAFAPTGLVQPGYQIMSRLMAERQWGVFCLGAGCFGVVTAFSGNWRVRIISAGVLAATYFLLASLIFLGNPHASGSSLFFGYAVLGAMLAYSTARLSERIKQWTIPR